ncbi:hypothetical protein ACFLR7_01280 [Acidobacteriota bacterium]
MKKKKCPLDKEVMEGLGEGNLNPEFQKHISECPVCKDVVQVHTWMGQFKEKTWEIDLPKKDFPDARAVWDRTFARKRPDKQLVTKALRPLIFPQVLSFGVFIGGSIFLGIKGIFKFGNLFDSPAAARIFPFFLVLLSMVFLSAIFCALLLALEKRKRPV